MPAQMFVVDASGGAGVAFTSIAAAVAAVPNGSVLIVRAGTYGSFTITAKSLAVLGEPGVIVADFLANVGVVGLLPQQSVTLHRLELRSILSAGVIHCQSCQGEIVVQSCRVVPVASGGAGGGLQATMCPRLFVGDCVFESPSGPTVVLDRSDAVLVGTFCRPGAFGQPGVRLVDATAQIADCTIHGGGLSAAGAAVAFAGGVCSARVLGATILDTSASPWVPVPAVDGVGALRVDPAVQLASGSAAPWGAGVVATVQQMPVVAASPAPLGGVATASLRGPSAGIGGLFAGLPSPPVYLPLLVDPLFLDPTALVAFAGGPLAAPLTAAFVLPASPVLSGVRFGWQGWSFAAATGFALSNPGIVAVW